MNTTRRFSVRCDDPAVLISLNPITAQNGIDLYKIHVSLPDKTLPPKVTVEWEEDMIDHLHVWHPLTGMHHAMHQWFGATTVCSRFHFGAPIISTIGDMGCNRQTVALSDPITPTTLRFCVKDLDQQNKVGYSVTLFDGYCDNLKEYEVTLRIDTRPIPFSEAVQTV